MSYIWTFAPENQALLQRCLNAASPSNDSNKWLQKFGPRNMDIIDKSADIITLNDSPELEETPATQEKQDEDFSTAIDEFLDPEIDLLSKFSNLVEKCRKTPKLLVKLAESLPTSTAEKLFNHILNSEDLNMDFLAAFYKYFVHSYIKRENSRFCTDILLQSFNKYPQYLKITLKNILKDLDVQNNVLNDFILQLNATNQTNFLETLANIELTAEEFSYNLFNIYTAYKSCNKTDSVQNYVISCLENYCNFCSNDKNYGRLLLAFLQYESSSKHDIDVVLLEALVERHKSPFKRPCLSVLNEIKDEK